MATTEGCLIASITRGCKAVSFNGVESKVVHDGMTRGPVLRFPSASRASVAMEWLQNPETFELLKQKFDSTSRKNWRRNGHEYVI
ncbi:putative hydroxymethylglutaryl-coenzyme A reductase [Trypoxylus dichotomus]